MKPLPTWMFLILYSPLLFLGLLASVFASLFGRMYFEDVVYDELHTQSTDGTLRSGLTMSEVVSDSILAYWIYELVFVVGAVLLFCFIAGIVETFRPRKKEMPRHSLERRWVVFAMLCYLISTLGPLSATITYILRMYHRI